MSEELPRLYSDKEFSELREGQRRREVAERRVAARRVAVRRSSDRWADARPDGRPESTMEQKFPHIAKKLTLAWRSEACAAYLSSLTVADRTNRQGFPIEVMQDLLMLYEINAMLMGISA